MNNEKISKILKQKVQSIKNAKVVIAGLYSKFEELSLLEFCELLATKEFSIQFYRSGKICSVTVNSKSIDYKIEFVLSKNELSILIERIENLQANIIDIDIYMGYIITDGSIEFISIDF